jgi:hypothetical protein
VSELKEPQLLSIGVMSVATNIYFEYWKKMVESADKHSVRSDRITFFVFTEQVEKLQKFADSLSNVDVQGFEISPYGWPDATLLRYHIFTQRYSAMTTDVLMHLDADMIFVSNPWARIRQLLYKNEICLVLHPGYWRIKGFDGLIFYMTHPIIAYKDFRMKIRLGGVGAWETRPDSAAFVPKEFRKQYYCGANWFGLRKSIGNLLKVLSDQVLLDRKNNVIAQWHDESHLNRWAASNAHNSCSPELCFDESYSQLKKLSPCIIAVRKIEKTR